MEKKKKTEHIIEEYRKRLVAIAETKFGTLADDAILGLLAERKEIDASIAEEERKQKAEEMRREEERQQAEARKAQEAKRERVIREQEKKKERLRAEIETLNASIAPDKADDELLTLIARRKELEAALIALDTDKKDEEEQIERVIPPAPAVETPLVEERISAEVGEMSIGQSAPVQEAAPTPDFKTSLKQDFGSESITEESFEEGSELARYLDQLKNSTASLGTLLQEMPQDAKQNKTFMLKVAEIDPAYAMHYADLALKKNESFNIRVAAMKNPRNSGNALAEMLPEARTSKVVLTGVRQDYRNVKFIQPNMEDYDEILRIAKTAALQRVKELKEGADIALLVPRILQQDKEFMREIENVTAGEKTASPESV